MLFYNPDLHDDEIKLVLKETADAVPEKNYVPAYKFDIALSDGTPIGKCDLRVGHNRNTYFGGNIGYSIDEQYRGHAYAARACRLLFELARMHGMDYLIITCGTWNTASSRTCLHAGGMLIATEDLPQDTELYQAGERTIYVYKFLIHDMRRLFTLDMKNYDPKGPIRNRHSVRGIIIRNGRIAMAHVTRFGYYKFPGGGSEGTESKEQTLIREVREESGLVVKPQTIRPYGYVPRIQGKKGMLFYQDNFYYSCDAEDEVASQMLTEKEAENGYMLEFVEPKAAITACRNSEAYSDPYVHASLERECKVLELLISEGYFN